MNSAVRDFLKVIREGRCENTYKLAWGRAIIEICIEQPTERKICLSDIAQKVFKYYWNQTIFFGMTKGYLEQSQNPAKEPGIIQYVKESILAYQSDTGNLKPELFEKISSRIIFDPEKVVKILKQDVSWRFQNLSDHNVQIYDYEENQEDDWILLNAPEAINDHSDILFEAINFRWSRELERFNPSTPQICKKVLLLDRGEVKRQSLKKFDKHLDLENPEKICFRCNNKIDPDQLSRDHVLPWSFVFSDDLWNIVYVHKSCNSEKSNRIPSKQNINNLLDRNKRLTPLVKNKTKFEMEYASDHKVIEALWIACGGS